MVWCNEAIVIDRVPRSRLQHRWVLQRAYRSGNSATRVSLTLSSSRSERARVRLRSTVHGAMRVTGGAFRMLAGVLAGSISHRARGRRTINRGAGMLAGAYGGVYAEYARVESASVPTDGRCEASMS